MITEKRIKTIMREYGDVFEILKNYDETFELPFQRKRVDITLPVRIINELKLLSKKTGKPISRIIEERVGF